MLRDRAEHRVQVGGKEAPAVVAAPGDRCPVRAAEAPVAPVARAAAELDQAELAPAERAQELDRGEGASAAWEGRPGRRPGDQCRRCFRSQNRLVPRSKAAI